jgi:hypothetical protein
MRPRNPYDDFLAMAGLSFLTVVSALSISAYDWIIVTGVSAVRLPRNSGKGP